MPIPHYEVVKDIGELAVKDMVRLCIDLTFDRCWLELSNFGAIYAGADESQMVRVYIGACKRGGDWLPMTPGLATRYKSIELAGSIGLPSRIAAFQRAIVDEWRAFDAKHIDRFAKGTTFGKSHTSASFAAKALKTGYDAAGVPEKAYSGIKISGWSASDLEKYAKSREHLLGFRDKDVRALGDLAGDFLELPPMPQYDGKEEPSPGTVNGLKDKEIELIPSAKAAKHSGNFAYAKELKDIPFRRVVSYGFRGDTRPPWEFKSDSGRSMQGFTPNYTRPRHSEIMDEKLAEAVVKTKAYEDADAATRKAMIKRYLADPANAAAIRAQREKKMLAGAGGLNALSIADKETSALSLGDYINSELLGGYISLSKNALVARTFVSRKGWVYCIFAEGGFEVPRKGRHPWATKNEAEIALPGMADWEDVVGFRQVDPTGQFTGPVYLRRSLHRKDPPAFARIFEIFSGKNQ